VPWIEFLVGTGRLATEYVHASGRKVIEVMTPDVRTVTEDTSLDDIVHLMERYQIKRVGHAVPAKSSAPISAGNPSLLGRSPRFPRELNLEGGAQLDVWTSGLGMFPARIAALGRRSGFLLGRAVSQASS
jgi:hypothetical protein